MESKNINTANICLAILAMVALTTGLIFTRPVLVPFVISLFIYLVVSPFVKWLQRKCHLPRSLAVGMTILIFLSLSSFMLFFIVGSLGDFITSANMYRNRMVDFIQWGGNFTAQWGIPFDEETIKAELRNFPIFQMVKNITGGLFSIVGNTMLVVIFVAFLISGERKGEGSTSPYSSFLSEIEIKIFRYLATKFITSLSSGFLIWLILASFQVDLAFMFGVLGVFLNFIPSLGGIFCTALPLPIILLQFGLSWKFYFILAVTMAIMFLIGNAIEPKLMGESLDLHPVAILSFLIFWGLVWGIPGMFMAVPITAILKIIFERIPLTRPLSELLAGRIPLWR